VRRQRVALRNVSAYRRGLSGKRPPRTVGLRSRVIGVACLNMEKHHVIALNRLAR
jgi:hypothetical protein